MSNTNDLSELDDIRRMPALLGPAPGPRNMPKSKMHLRFAGDITVFTITAVSDTAALTRLLPPKCRLMDEPLIEINFVVQTNLGWLAGRGYNFLNVRIPVILSSKQGELRCGYTPVLWENMADPIITGRDELGSPKLFANLPDPARLDDSYHGSADWYGFRFFDMTLSNLQSVAEPPAPGLPLLLYRYLVRTGDWRQADVAQLTKSNKGTAPAPVIHEHWSGQGRFSFHHARWEDMPTQYTFINTLAELRLNEFRGARVLKMSGITDLAAYEIIE